MALATIYSSKASQDLAHQEKTAQRKSKGKTKMKKVYVCYKKQCDYCISKGKCDHEKKTRTFCETIGGVESLASGVFGSLNFKCDYFDLDDLAYKKENPPESCD